MIEDETKDEIVEILNEVKDEVKRKYKADIKGIFGSYVRGDEKKTSKLKRRKDFGRLELGITFLAQVQSLF